jgi:hypothetical protein
MSQYLAVVVVTAALLSQAVAAAVLTADNEIPLCTTSHQGKPAVDKDALAYAIVDEAGAGRYLDGSNPTGLRDGAIQLRTAGGVQSEPVYVVLNFGTKAVPAENQPFGPNVDLRTDKRALQARDAIAKIMGELIFLTTNGSVAAGPELTYRIERRMVVGAPTAEIEWANPVLLFRDDPPLVIICETQLPPPTPAERPQRPSIGISAANVIRLRGTVKDLTIKVDDLRSAKPAFVTYQRDGEANTETFGLNAVLGVRVGDKAGVFDAIPFISYENRSVTGSKGDIEKLSPGLLFGYRIERPDFAIHARLETSLIEDLQFDARQGKLRVYIDPAFALGSGRGVLFGSYLTPIGPLQWRPDLTLIGDASHIYDKGTNPALDGASDYLGLGGELSLRARLDLGQPISDFVLHVGVRDLQLFGDIRKHEARRWFSILEYAPANFPYLGIGLSFSKGENDDTFQDEEIYGLNFTVRY